MSEQKVEWLALLQTHLINSFTREELVQLSFELGIESEDFPKDGRTGFAREMLLYLRRIGRINELLPKLQHMRPLVWWQLVFDASTTTEVNEPLFFLSYAKRDDDPVYHFVADFHDRLVAQICKLLEPYWARDRIESFKKAQAEHLARSSTETTMRAMCRCKTFVSLLSHDFFEEDDCGKQLSFFQARVQDHATSANRGKYRDAPLIQPVCLTLPDQIKQRVASIGGLDFLRADVHPELNNVGGLRSLLQKSSTHHIACSEFFNRLARQLLDAVDKYPLRPLETSPNTIDIQSAFRGPQSQQQSRRDGSLRAQFFVIACKKDELPPRRKATDFYGVDGVDWKPYLPESDETIAWVAQGVAHDERLISNVQGASPGMFELIHKAEENNHIVVLIVDPWAMMIDPYWGWMQRYDRDERPQASNNIVVISWNSHDHETEGNRDLLEHVMKESIFPKTIERSKNDPATFLYPITTLDAFKKELSITLVKLKARNISSADIQRPVSGARQIIQPVIIGPSGV